MGHLSSLLYIVVDDYNSIDIIGAIEWRCFSRR